MMKRVLITLVLLCLSVPTLAAEPASTIDCNAFEEQAIADSNIYKDVHTKAVSIASAMCFSLRNIFDGGSPLAGKTADEKITQVLAEFGAFAAQALKDDFPETKDSVIKLNENVEEMEEQLASTNLATGRFPEFKTAMTIEGGYKGYFSSAVRAEKFSFPRDLEDCRKVREANKDCKAVFNDYKEAFNAYRQAYDQFVTGVNKHLLINLNEDWNRFLEVSKSQTGLEVWLTTLWHRDLFKKDHIVGPPPTQVIALHPRLVYEYVDTAVDGDNAEFGVAVEWVGMNWWDMRVPLGFSVASVYADRVSVPSVRTGIMLHIDNKYSIGWGHRSGANSIYFSLDLLQLLQGKKQQYERFVQ